MARLTTLKHLFVAAIGISGIVVACRATSPEAPPLAPAPDPNSPSPNPVPSGPTAPDDPTLPGPHYPTEDGGAPIPDPGPSPKQPGPMSSNGSLKEPGRISSVRAPNEPGRISSREMPIPDLRAEQYQLVDAGLRDTATARDAMPADTAIYDARPRTDATLPPPADAAVRNP